MTSVDQSCDLSLSVNPGHDLPVPRRNADHATSRAAMTVEGTSRPCQRSGASRAAPGSGDVPPSAGRRTATDPCRLRVQPTAYPAAGADGAGVRVRATASYVGAGSDNQRRHHTPTQHETQQTTESSQPCHISTSPLCPFSLLREWHAPTGHKSYFTNTIVYIICNITKLSPTPTHDAKISSHHLIPPFDDPEFP